MSQRRLADGDSDDGGASSDDASQPPRRLSRINARSERQCECFCGELLELFWESCGMCCVPVTVLLGVLAYVLTMPPGEHAPRESAAVARGRASAAPVRRFGSSPLDGPVDLIFLWVNGSDPHHRQALQHAREAKLLPYAPHVSRFRDEGIFEYALRSALGAAVMTQIRHVHLVTSGEIPIWLPSALGITPGAWPSFTNATLSAPLAPLLNLSGRAPAAAAAAGSEAGGEVGGEVGGLGGEVGEGGGRGGNRGGGARRRGGGAVEEERRFFVVPHCEILRDTELPTFNSNALNAALHRIPNLAPWFVYSDDDILFANPKQTLDAWWDNGGVDARRGVELRGRRNSGGGRATAGRRRLSVSSGRRRNGPRGPDGRQRLYFQDSAVRATQPRKGNKWEDSMRYMASLLDALPRAVAQPSPPPPPSPLPPPPATVLELTRRGWRAVLSAATARRVGVRPRPAARIYPKPQHMPVLMSVAVLKEMEQLWPEAFAATRRNRLRASEELETNFLYHHYVRLQRYPTAAMPNRRVGFGWMHECGEGVPGAARCARKLSAAVHDWVCFNDKEVMGKPYHSGATALRVLLHRRFGSFGGGALPNASSERWSAADDPEPAAGAHLNLSGAMPGYCGWTTKEGSCASGAKGAWNTDALGIHSLADCMVRFLVITPRHPQPGRLHGAFPSYQP